MLALGIHRATRHERIDVDVLNAVVTLRGVVATANVRTAAVSTAAQVPGVCRVQDRLRASSTAVGVDLRALEATVAVGRAFAADPRLCRTDIAIRVDDGTVTLSGFVDDADDVDAAGRIAAAVPSVRAVRNRLVAVRLVAMARATMRNGGRP